MRHYIQLLPVLMFCLSISKAFSQPILRGYILNAPAGEGIEKVNVSFLQDPMVHPSYFTDATGYYDLMGAVASIDYPIIIRPERNDHHKLGVTTLDLIKLLKHLLGTDPLKSPYQYIAADANNSESLSALDLIEIRKIILGINVEFSDSPSWRFVREGYEFPDMINLWPFDTFLMQAPPYEITLTAVDTSERYDFIGVKIGDINGAYDPNITSPLESRTLPEVISLRTPSQLLTTGQIVHVPVYPGEQTDVMALQFTLTHPGLEFAGIQSGQITLADDDYAHFQDQMTLSWFDIGTRTLDPGQPLFTLSFVANVSGSLDRHLHLTSDITQAEWYDAEEKLLEPSMVFEEKSTDLSAIYTRVSPNPWSDVTTIQYPVMCDGEIRLTITDFLGRPVHQRTEMASSPLHSIQVSGNDVPLAGTYIYTVATSAGQVSGRMVRIKP